MLVSLIISSNLPVPTKEKYKNGMDRNNDLKKSLYKCIMANASVITQQAVHTTYQLSCSWWQEPYKKAHLLMRNGGGFSPQSRENGPLPEKWQDTKSKRTRQKNKKGDRKGESNDSPEIPGRMWTSDIPGLPLGMLAKTANCSKLSAVVVLSSQTSVSKIKTVITDGNF